MVKKLPKKPAIGAAISAVLSFHSAQATQAPHECMTWANSFLNHPTARSLGKSAPDRCWSLIDGNPHRFRRLLMLVGAGNRVAARYLASNLRSTDGGNAEDATVALARFADRAGDRFILLLAKEGQISGGQLQDIYGVTDPSLADRFARQRSVLALREKRLVALHDASLSKERATALSAVRQSLHEVQATPKG